LNRIASAKKRAHAGKAVLDDICRCCCTAADQVIITVDLDTYAQASRAAEVWIIIGQ
jgi:hypothetical protein